MGSRTPTEAPAASSLVSADLRKPSRPPVQDASASTTTATATATATATTRHTAPTHLLHAHASSLATVTVKTPVYQELCLLQSCY